MPIGGRGVAVGGVSGVGVADGTSGVGVLVGLAAVGVKVGRGVLVGVGVGVGLAAQPTLLSSTATSRTAAPRRWIVKA